MNNEKKIPYRLFGVLISILIGVIAFSLLFSYVCKNARSSIYMDQIRFIADNLERVYENEFTFKDCFQIHSGHFSIGTYLILLFQIIHLGFENNTLLTKLIPFCLLAIYLILSIYRILRKESSYKEMIISVIFNITIAFILFSLFQFEIIFFTYGAIIFYSNVLFILSLCLTIGYFNNTKRLYLLILGVLFGVSNIFLFGSGYDYAFIFAFEFINVFAIIKYFKTDKKATIAFSVSAIIYLAVFLFLLISLLSNKGGSEVNLESESLIKDSFIFMFNAVASLFIPNYSVYKTGYIILGVLFVVVAIFAIYLFFKNKELRKDIMPISLIAFSGMVYISVYGSRFSYGLTYGMASRYFTSYLYLLIGVIDIYFSYFSLLKVNKENTKSIVTKVISGLIPLTLVLSVIVTQIKDIKNEMIITPYRLEINEKMVEYSLYYEYFDDETLETIYQADADAIRNCFASLQKHELYVFNPECDLIPNISSRLMECETSMGNYNDGSGTICLTKKAIFVLKTDKEIDMDIKLYNPSAFPLNTFNISVNTEYVYENEEISSNEIKDVEFTLRKGVNTILFDIEEDYVPKELGISEDERHIALFMQDATIY